jgi:hypothetical protein
LSVTNLTLILFGCLIPYTFNIRKRRMNTNSKVNKVKGERRDRIRCDSYTMDCYLDRRDYRILDLKELITIALLYLSFPWF